MNKFFSKRGIIFLFTVFTIPFKTIAQDPGNISLKGAKFIIGDNPSYQSVSFDDSQWETQQLGTVWQEQGHPDYHAVHTGRNLNP